MKRTLRVIVPLILILAVIGCTTWYLLVYDRDFTKDFLLQQARSFEEAGNHQLSAWLYEVAYQQSSKEPQVAIELAEQYAKDNNYTKAEFTLTNAISETASPVLYAKLAAIYVEQDKLLDAVTMLDSIKDPSVKATLDAMRPEAPILTPDPGFYNQYISVSAKPTDDDVYMGINGEYPSINSPYTNSITLDSGETTVYALTVSENGLVSKLTVGGYTVGGVVELVTFKDPAIEEEIRNILMVASTTPIYSDDLWDIKNFRVPEGATSCEDLMYLPYLRVLHIPYATTTDLSILSDLTSLEELVIIDSSLDNSEINAIGTLTALHKLTLRNCSITSISALGALKNLTFLDLTGNTIRNVTPLSNLKKIQSLMLESNAISDISALATLTELKELTISQNAISSLDALSGLTSITKLYVSHNQLTTLAPLSTLTGLTVLEAANNSLTDIAALSSCASLSELDLSNNVLMDVQALSNAGKLTKLNLAYNQIKELPAFSNNCTLVVIDASHNQLTTLSTLSVLKHLNEVHVDYNKDLSSLKPLDSCNLLILVNAYGTSVTEVSFLTEKSVIVNFDPTV